MSDISLLPEGLRGNEQAPKVGTPPTPSLTAPGDLKMHVPSSVMADEDIEIIEVDESDLGAILADEPLFTRLSYQASAFLDSVKEKLFENKAAAPPPKLPPQFFSPPKTGGLVTKPGSPAAPGAAAGPAAASATAAAGAGAHSRVRITPQAEVPRRVRVIRRVRKPVRVSLISSEDVLAYRADVPRRKWTLVICILLFSSIIGGGYWLLNQRVQDAQKALNELQVKIVAVESDVATNETTWNSYRDLQRRLTILNGLLNQHTVITRFFDFLEQWTLPEVTYQNASFSPGGSVSLSVTAPSYAAAARQIVAFQRSPLVQQVQANSFSSGGGDVSFQMSLIIDSKSFHGPLSTPGEASSTTPVTSP
jgi:hypothetical protein